LKNGAGKGIMGKKGCRYEVFWGAKNPKIWLKKQKGGEKSGKVS